MSKAIKIWHQNFLRIIGHASTFRLSSSDSSQEPSTCGIYFPNLIFTSELMWIAIKFWHQTFLCIIGHAWTFRRSSSYSGQEPSTCGIYFPNLIFTSELMSIAIKFWHQNFLCITGHAMTFRIGSRKVGMLRDDQLCAESFGKISAHNWSSLNIPTFLLPIRVKSHEPVEFIF
jgi:hypothetical protein